MRFLAYVGFLAILLGIGAAVYFFGGFYNVAGIEEQPAVVDWALANVRAASIERHATQAPPSSLGDSATVQEGARQFAARGCLNCHGAPGVNWAKWSEGLRPYPADLKEMARARTPAELFWAIKNGIKMTAMPGFGATGTPDDDIWKIVAFVKKWPDVTESDYKTWTASP